MADVVAELGRVRPAESGRAKGRLLPVWYATAALLLVLGVGAAYWFARFRAESGRLAKSLEAAGSGAAEEGSRLIPVTSSPGEEMWPTFSPDGNQIAFTYQEAGTSPSHLFVKLIGQNDAVQLTRGPAADLFPAWSPDGRWIAFLRNSAPLAGGMPTGTGCGFDVDPGHRGARAKIGTNRPGSGLCQPHFLAPWGEMDCYRGPWRKRSLRHDTYHLRCGWHRSAS